MYSFVSYVCKQTFQISQVRITQKVNAVIVPNLSAYYLSEDIDICRYSDLH